jgi:hypothetical protein
VLFPPQCHHQLFRQKIVIQLAIRHSLNIPDIGFPLSENVTSKAVGSAVEELLIVMDNLYSYFEYILNKPTQEIRVTNKDLPAKYRVPHGPALMSLQLQ